MFRPALAALTVAVLSTGAMAGRWITPDWPEGKEPRFAPVPLYWFEVRECPIVYLTVIQVPKECDRATVLARTSGYIYVYVDGKLVYGWAPRPRTKDSPSVSADPDRVHEIDLSAALRPAVAHALAVSAPAKGFVLDGGLYAGAQRLAPLASDEKWTVAKFAPTTILEDNPFLRPGFKGEAAPVKPGEEWKADEDTLAKVYYAAAVKQGRENLADASWRLDLLEQKGVYISGGRACGWGGPNRLDAESLAPFKELRAFATTFAAMLAEVEQSAAASAADLAKALPQLKPVVAGAAELREGVDVLSSELQREESRRGFIITRRDFADAAQRWAELAPGSVQRQMESPPAPGTADLTGHLNESRYDRLGWINHPGLSDSDISRWGIRIKPVTGPTKVQAPQRWLFATDPKDEGVKELRWSIGYNIETQMAAIPCGGGWQAVPRFADYKGAAWYRVRLAVPGEWAGNEVMLTLPIAGQERLWLNDHEITARASGEGRRTYRLAAKDINFGGENVLALRIVADGPRRGLVGTVEAACPALEGDAGKDTPRVDVLATPLSPCVVLTPQTDTLEVHHPGKARVCVPAEIAFIRRDTYQTDKDGRLKGNHVLLWMWPKEGNGEAARPILLVFQANPLSINCEPGLTRVRLATAGQRIIAVRPRVRQKQPSAAWSEKSELWTRAALAVPINYMEVTRVLRPGEPYEDISVDKVPAGPVLGHTVIYDYLETRDEWGTAPLRLAPLPALCSYAVDTKFRGLVVDQKDKVETLQDGGILAPYRAVRDAERVSYSYPVEPYPRLAGFTSWMFAGGDAGVTGNGRECELLAAAGANSFRPQHNWSDQMPPKGMFPADDKRTRVQITADYCRAAGINYMNNIDQTLGRPREEVQQDYDKFLPLVYGHYEKIARQLGTRAFWEVAYDLVNEPFDHKHPAYNAAMKELSRRVRAIDRRHLLYIEPCEAWGAIQQLALIQPTGDPLTVYSFHDYNFRLFKPADRWPTLERDITSLYQMWLPAIKFQIEHGVCLHCGEFGGFDPSTDDSEAQTLLMNDFFRIFDQFGMHHHYYSGRQIYQRLADGSVRPSNVVRAYRAYFARGDFNAYYKPWPGQPKVGP